MPETTTIEIIAGPTASGKSSTAMARAREVDGVIINADSLQVYDALPILTARPSEQEMAQIPHRLYAVLAPDQPCSAGNWREMAQPVIEEVLNSGHRPIVVGGSGLYLDALINGLSPIPDIPREVRRRANARLDELGHEAFLEELEARDPGTARHIDTRNHARLIRAWEVIEATGTPLIEWQRRPRQGPPAHWRFAITPIIPERATLRARCDTRFDDMITQGALAEVTDLDRRIRSRELAGDAPVTRALGFAELRAYLHGQTGWEAALEAAKARTRQYAKRQVTWFRNQLPAGGGGCLHTSGTQ
jgi:tRNA dimethylallyltransferase